MTHPKKRSPKISVDLTYQALSDLCEIERYSVKEWGRKVADKYVGDIDAALTRLREDPEILRLEPDFSPGVYFYRVNKHVLVCDFEGESVVILTVIHTSMDVPTRLRELEPRLIAECQMLRNKLRKKENFTQDSDVNTV